MKKKAVLRGLLGFPLGIAIGYVLSILISLSWGDGFYYPCVPAFEEAMGSQINAVLVQTLLSGVIGTAFAASSVIWEIDHWSIAKQTGIYFLITSIVMMPAAYINNWMEHSVTGFLSYFGIFAGIFIAIWATQYFMWKRKIDKMNKKLK